MKTLTIRLSSALLWDVGLALFFLLLCFVKTTVRVSAHWASDVTMETPRTVQSKLELFKI